MNIRDKFQICRIKIYSIRFLANFKVFGDFADLPEFYSSATTQNILVRG